ncbi:MFS transporter [Actinospica durhamensis]|uniref:MFS transporter n=1 Tax=Actinospica durhamensis TaxID=1508375 RepID=A0A941EK93_9ACTN|nr:MFS transporter [Actinospica durhamensis]MBR7831888.1 MFS transporter [Actinospica durhamensis]
MRKWLPLLTISLSTFMLLLDVTIVSVALPTMTSALNSSFSALQWTVDLYVLVLASLLMAIGSASDLWGRRRTFLVGLIVFAVSSLVCGLAPDTGVLIAARAVQGVGGSAMLATNGALIGSNYSGKDRGVAFGVWGAVMGAASAVGPILGGLLTEHISWRSIFLVNLPVAAIAIVLGMRTLNETRNPNRTRVDLPGTLTFTAGVTAVVYGLIEAGDKSWGDTATVTAFAAAAVCLIAFVLVERSRPNPMLDLSLFRRPSFSALMAGGLFLHVAAFGNLIYVSLWAQTVLGMDAVKAGLVLTPLAGLAFVTAWLAGKYLEHRVSPQHLIGVGLILVGAGAAANARIGADSSWTVLLPGFLVAGVGVGFSSPVLASAALGAAPPQRAGMATGAINTFRQLGFALAVPVFATVITGGTEHVLSDSGLFPDASAASTQLTAGQAGRLVAAAPSAGRAAVAHALHDAYATGLQRVFLISAVIGVLAGVGVLALVRNPAEAPVPASAPARAVAPSSE